MVLQIHQASHGIGVQLVDNETQIKQLIEETIKADRLSSVAPRSGIIVNYDPISNTADVLMSEAVSDQPQDVITGVPCPTSIGIQQAAPNIGRGCWVVFDGVSQKNPYIISIHNLHYSKYDYDVQTRSSISIPTFLSEY